MSYKTSVLELSKAVSAFFPQEQLITLTHLILDADNSDGESESQYFIGILEKFKNTFEHMPKTYETAPVESENGENEVEHYLQQTGEAIAYLHYFVGGCDWWITEKDCKEEQHQAFGVVSLQGYSPELGYISITELTQLRVNGPYGFPLVIELDFNWEPTRLKDIPELAHMFEQRRT